MSRRPGRPGVLEEEPASCMSGRGHGSNVHGPHSLNGFPLACDPAGACGRMERSTAVEGDDVVLTVNALLALEGIDAAQVRLVRHQDNRLRPGRLSEAWRNDRPAFEAYLQVQSKDRFPVSELLASFVVTDARKTVFVGLYRIAAVDTCPRAPLTR